MYGRFDDKTRFVELVDFDAMINDCCASTTDSSTVIRLNCVVKGVSQAKNVRARR